MRRVMVGWLLLLLLSGCRGAETPVVVITLIAPPTPPVVASAAPAIITAAASLPATPPAAVAQVSPEVMATATTPPTVTVGPTFVWPTSVAPMILPSPTPTVPAATGVACPAPPGWQPHPVAAGDTVGQLAACVGAPAAAIVAANCLAHNGYLIYVGQVLWLPGVCAPPAAPPIAQPDTRGGAIPALVTPLPPTASPGFVLPTAPPASGEARITVDPWQGPPGTTINLILSDFNHDSAITVQIRYDGDPTIWDEFIVRVDGQGRLSILYTIPLTLSPGFLSIDAYDPADVGMKAQGEFQVTAADAGATSPTPTATITPTAEATPSPVTEPTEPPPAATPTPTVTSVPTDAPTAAPAPTETATAEPTAPPQNEPTVGP